MKKWQIVVVVFALLALAIPVTVYAASTKEVVDLSGMKNNTVVKFMDQGRVCYIVKGRVTESRAWPGNSYAISCLN